MQKKRPAAVRTHSANRAHSASKRIFTKWRVLQLAFSLILAALLIYFLVSKISLTEAFTVLGNISLSWLLVAFLLYIFTTWLKGIRWRVILKNVISLKDSFSMMGFSSMFINLLPFRLGEFGMPYLLKKKGIKLRNSLSYLIILRLFDFVSLVILFFLGLLLVGEAFRLPPLAYILIIIAFVLMIFALFAIIFFPAQLLGILKRILSRIVPLNTKNSACAKFLFKAELVSQEMAHLQKATILVNLFFLSLITWFLGVINLQIFLVSMGIAFPFTKTLLAITFQVLLSNLPIQGLAGFGTYEGFWALGFVLLGMDKSTAIISGLNSHLLLLLMTIILGIFGWLLLMKKKN
ncbi:MAG: lysylphosphatidylglycerol synthase transmembrane domain-containing protein [Nanoarchaeota archaeon]